MGSTNLLEETMKVLTDNGKSPADISHVVYHNIAFTWEIFAAYATLVDYDSGFGGVEVPHFEITGKGGTWNIIRANYDGSEWWRHWECKDFESLIKGTSSDMAGLLNSYCGYENLPDELPEVDADREELYRVAIEEDGEGPLLKGKDLEVIKIMLNTKRSK